ncbi:unnamed protein product [Symbiodinium sp. CCMP2456]|nr:unnamed protein product [Symbiodinium sp. CCMP2456]
MLFGRPRGQRGAVCSGGRVPSVAILGLRGVVHVHRGALEASKTCSELCAPT